MKANKIKSTFTGIKNVAPVITICPVAEGMIREWVDLCDKEISGLGKVIQRPDGSLHVSKVYLLEQEVTSVETELDDEAVATLLYETRMDEGEMTFWWHSHVNMNTDWSGTDYDTMIQFGSKGALISAVYNKRGDRRVALYVQGEGYHPTVFMDDLDMRADSLTVDVREFCKKQFEDKVTEKAPIRGYYGTTVDDCWGDWNDAYTPALVEDNVVPINFTDKSLESMGVPPHCIDKQKDYYKLILTKWFKQDVTMRKYWAVLYYEWNEHLPKPQDILSGTPKADLAEFADSFDFSVQKAEVDIDRYTEEV